jgi:hypothetical protein
MTNSRTASKGELEGLQESHDVFQGDGEIDVEVNRDHVHRAHLQRGADGREAEETVWTREVFGYVREREQHVSSSRTSTVAVPIIPL